MTIHDITLTTPEAVLAAAHQIQTDIPVDAIHCALARAKAVLYLLMSQLEGDEVRCSDAVLSDALWGVLGNVELAATMLTTRAATADHRIGDG